MSWASILSIGTAATGFVAAIYWLLASRIEPRPIWMDDPKLEPKSFEMHNFGWVRAMQKAFYISSKRNATAAIWTAASVVLGGLAVLAANYKF